MALSLAPGKVRGVEGKGERKNTLETALQSIGRTKLERGTRANKAHSRSTKPTESRGDDTEG